MGQAFPQCRPVFPEAAGAGRAPGGTPTSCLSTFVGLPAPTRGSRPGSVRGSGAPPCNTERHRALVRAVVELRWAQDCWHGGAKALRKRISARVALQQFMSAQSGARAPRKRKAAPPWHWHFPTPHRAVAPLTLPPWQLPEASGTLRA